MHYIVNAESGLFCNKDHEFRAFLQKCGFSVYSIEIKAVSDMLLGQSRNNLDSKGRIFVPVKWRPDTSDHVVVLIGLNPADVKKEERFLQILRYEKFVEFAKDLTSSRPSDLSLMRAKRKIFSSAEECTLDKQGRILIPQWLAKYANLKDEVLLCGVEDRILVWNPDDFEAAEADYTLNELCSDVQNYSDKTPGNSSAASLISSAFGG